MPLSVKDSALLEDIGVARPSGPSDLLPPDVSIIDLRSTVHPSKSCKDDRPSSCIPVDLSSGLIFVTSGESGPLAIDAY